MPEYSLTVEEIGSPSAGTPTTAGPSSVVNVADALPIDAVDVTIGIEPVQSGSGTPSPDNIRTISGYTEATVTVSPTNDPSDGTGYTASWTDEAGTVYGGTLDVTTGELTAEWAMVTIDGVNVTVGNNGQTSVATHAMYSANSPAKNPGVSNILSDKFVYGAGNFVGQIVGRAGNTGVEFKLPTSVADSYAGVNGWFAENPTQLLYELATPVTYQIDPLAIPLLAGTNYVSNDAGGDTTLEYCPTGTAITIPVTAPISVEVTD